MTEPGDFSVDLEVSAEPQLQSEEGQVTVPNEQQEQIQLRRSQRVKTLTEKGKEMQEKTIQGLQQRFNYNFEKWRTHAKSSKQTLSQSDALSEDLLKDIIGDVTGLRADVTKVYEELRKLTPPDQATRRRVDLCVEISNYIVKKATARLEGEEDEEQDWPEAGSLFQTTKNLEADSTSTLQRQVEEMLGVVLKHHPSTEERSSLVHCGRTKVFLTQVMLDLLEDQRKKILSQCAFTIQCCWLRYQRRRCHARRQSATLIQAAVRSWLVRKRVRRWNRAAGAIQNAWRKWRSLLKSLAEAELDDAKDLVEEEDAPAVNPVVRERGSVQLSTIQEPVTVRGWPMGLALASAPSMTVSLTATGFQKMMSVMASLNLPSRRGEYQVKTNQYTEELASIRAQPKGSVKLHYQRSPLLYADRQPDLKSDVTGFNEILLEKTL